MILLNKFIMGAVRKILESGIKYLTGQFNLTLRLQKGGDLLKFNIHSFPTYKMELPKEWYPHKYIYGEPFVLMLLNLPFSKAQEEFIKRNWNKAVFRVAVDGGANRLKDSFSSENFIPHLVCGDFDSATTENLDFYRKNGVDVVCTPDQDETDFTKALRLTCQYLANKEIQASSIVAVAKNGERLDHLIGNLNTLYLAKEITALPVILYGNDSLTWLLSAGSHKIHITKEMMNSHVGLFPLGSVCTDVSTTGLKWNLAHHKMNFGGLISTCNLFDGSDTVCVTTDTPLIWSMELNGET